MPVPYLLDTNFFIDAHRTSFPFDVVPSFWAQVSSLAKSGVIWSIDKVHDEICRNEDELATGIQSELPVNFFQPSAPVLAEYRQVVGWVASMSHHYKSAALSVFMQADEADAWLVAHATTALPAYYA